MKLDTTIAPGTFGGQAGLESIDLVYACVRFISRHLRVAIATVSVGVLMIVAAVIVVVRGAKRRRGGSTA
jgi:hypothetical protein